MPAALDSWQKRLEEHFTALAAARTVSQLPLFALEHGLSDDELDELSALLRTRLAAGLRLAPHWLAWVVYATESGYTYAGDEYWASFTAASPGWQLVDRYRISTWFKKFQQAFNGVIPSGPWANHFSIISWPITHSILPQFLQHQFARALFDLRFQLASIADADGAGIGRLLAANAVHPSSRLEQFLQQEELVGRIVLALIHKTPMEGEEPIYQPTLSRIVSDLRQVRSAREWLTETQRVATDRFRVIGRTAGSTQTPVPSQHGRNAGPMMPDIRPRLLLRHAGPANWSVLMEVPAFSGVATQSSDIRRFLKQSRCRLSGATDFKPAGWVLSGRRVGVLRSWPLADEPLIEFEKPNSYLSDLFLATCRMTPGPVWLFRLKSDGTAFEVKSGVVRAGNDYVLVGSTVPTDFPGIERCSLDCSGATAVRFSVPANVSSRYINWFSRVGLKYVRTIEVWPAGLPGRGWDTEGTSEWLTTERPVFGFVHDGPVDGYILRLDQDAPTLIKPGPIGDPVFVRLDPLPAGRHVLNVHAVKPASPETQPFGSALGVIELKVREPVPWTPGATLHTGLVVTTVPFEADLDTFWKNEVSLSVFGPPSHQVACHVNLHDGRGGLLLSEDVGDVFDLPVTPDAWSKRFGSFLDREDVAWRYLEASTGTLAVNGGELGEFRIRFERHSLPLRWALKYDRGAVIATLMDDTGTEESDPECSFFSFEEPLLSVSYGVEALRQGVSLKPPGGLFVARHGDHSDALVISAGLSGEGLRGLGVYPNLDPVRHRSTSLGEALRTLRHWSDARVAGFLCAIRLKSVLDSFRSAIYEELCGTSWVQAEAAFLRSSSSSDAATRLQRGVERHSGFAALLRRDAEKATKDQDGGANWYAEAAARYGLTSDRALSRLAFSLAASPWNVSSMFGAELDDNLERLRTKPALLRGARLVALLSGATNKGNRCTTDLGRQT
jgi:hypothetical protein